MAKAQKPPHYYAVIGRVPHGDNETYLVRASSKAQAKAMAKRLIGETLDASEKRDYTRDEGAWCYIDAVLRSSRPIQHVE